MDDVLNSVSLNVGGERKLTNRRTRLREFQAQLVERMQSTKTGEQVVGAQLGIVLGQTNWLLDLKEAGEIVSVGALTHVPLTKNWYRGLTNIRGSLYSVVDINAFHGQEPMEISSDSRVIAFSPSLAFNSALLVTRILGLRKSSDMELLQAQASALPEWAGRQFSDSDAEVWTELRLSTLIANQDFLHIAA